MWGKLFHLAPAVPISKILVLTGLFLLIHACAWAFLIIAKKKEDLADIAWGLGFFLVAWVSFFLSPFSMFGLTVNALISLWTLRQIVYVHFRNQYRAERDQRLKKREGKTGSLKVFFRVFFFQGVVLYLVALPIPWIHTHPEETSWNFLWFASTFWISGFTLEVLSEYQLIRFLQKPANHDKLLTTGFWGYARHPNFLGELLQWWTIWSLTLTLPFGWALIASPLLLSLLIVKISGIPPLDEKLKRYPNFKEYLKTTPEIFPPPFLNGTLYTFAWIFLIGLGYKEPLWFSLLVFTIIYALQLCLFSRWDKTSLLLSLPLSIYAALIGLVQEELFVHFKILAYSNPSLLPPFWLLAMYPMVALTLNSAFALLNRNLLLPFFAGGIGAFFAYFSGAKVEAVRVFGFLEYGIICATWGISLTILIFLNRKLLKLRVKYTKPLTLLLQAPGFKLLQK